MRALAAGAAAALALVPGLAHAQGPAEPFDGTNPFDCVLQQAGTGAEFPDPGADPFCVEYEKRHQNVTELGVVQFLSLEPARVAAASPKCFYFQRDHWVGSVVQDDGRTETYAWDGSYYFDKAKAAGGAYVENFTVNNQSGDPTATPGFPEEWKPYFGYGRGGFRAPGSVEADPSCAAKAEQRSPYRRPPQEKPESAQCPEARGSVGFKIGGLGLGMTRARMRQENGAPKRRVRGFWRYCVRGGGKYMAGYPIVKVRMPDDYAEFLFTTNPGFHIRGVRRLTPKAQMRRRLRGEHLLRKTQKTELWVVRRTFTLMVVIRHGAVRALATAERGHSRRWLIDYYRRSQISAAHAGQGPLH
jgi:hypothetical protein